MEQALQKPKKKLLDRIMTVILGIFVGLVVLVEGFGMISARSNYGVPNFFGYQTMVVLTSSMDPTLPVDSAIVVQRIEDFSTLNPSTNLVSKDGDIISFRTTIEGQSAIITHRIVAIRIEGGKYVFDTKGDNNLNQIPQDYNISQDMVLGKVIYMSVGLGMVQKFLSNPIVMFLLVLIPLGYIVFLSIRDFVKALKQKPVEEVAVPVSTISEEELEKIKEAEKAALKEAIRLEKERLKEEIRKEMENKD